MWLGLFTWDWVCVGGAVVPADLAPSATERGGEWLLGWVGGSSVLLAGHVLALL